eukprot:TRINITY_DN3354_c0_g1_i1.p1 TRINITY_DN3354_c0_g1~~TRINITY_DN3354_c0_g1_i1.p1  ORF type:complete len:378 (-),score=81.05 TRINITY_DN3354_c0_g1_i1:73-1206(-)
MQKPTYDPALASELEYKDDFKGITFTGTNGVTLEQLPAVFETETDLVKKKKRLDIVESMTTKKEQNAIILKRAETRNIIFLGRSRSGKSTVLRTLRFPYSFPEELSLFACTKEPDLHSFTVEYTDPETDQKTNFNVNIMDTPGLFEVTEAGKKRTNAMLKEMISDCLAFEITHIHALFFLCSFSGGINHHDIQAILDMNEMFKGADKVFNLLVTRCESSSDRPQLEAQIRSIPELKDFFANPNVNLFFMGALEKDDFLMGSLESVEAKLEHILHMRQIFYRHIISTKSKCHLRDMEIFKRTHQSIEDLETHVGLLTRQVQSYEGTLEAREALRVELREKAAHLENAVAVLAGLTGEDRLRVLAGIIADARNTASSSA